MRKATAKLQDGKLELVCHPKEQGEYISLGEIDLSEFTKTTVCDLTFGEQVRGALLIGAGGGLCVSLFMLAVVVWRSGFEAIIDDFLVSLLIFAMLLIFGQVMGFLFSAVPIMIKTRASKLFELHQKNGQSIGLVVEVQRAGEATSVLSEFGLTPQPAATSEDVEP
jgi:hypothetical protein